MAEPVTFTINDAKDAPKNERKPRVAQTATPKATVSAATADVKKAMATLDSAYNMVATGFVMFGLTETGNAWIDAAEQLKLTNEDALKASPKLAKAIAGAGSTGGAATFILTHAMALAGVFGALRKELAERRVTAETEQSFEQPVSRDYDPTLIPGS